MRKNFIRLWMEDQVQQVQQPSVAQQPQVQQPVTPQVVQQPQVAPQPQAQPATQERDPLEIKAPALKDEERGDGVTIGNIGTKIVGTFVSWAQEGGFFENVKNPQVLENGKKQLLNLVKVFNQRVNKLSSSNPLVVKDLIEIQSKWMFTLGRRVQELVPNGDLVQIRLLSGKIEEKWRAYISSKEAEEAGIRVTEPSVLEEPL